MLLFPHAATSLEIQLLVRVWANDGAALGLSARRFFARAILRIKLSWRLTNTHTWRHETLRVRRIWRECKACGRDKQDYDLFHHRSLG
jgi:hypothetical protein